MKKIEKDPYPLKKVLFAVLIGVAVITFWRGIWGILDIYLFPNDYSISSWASVLIGLFILGITRSLRKQII